MCERSFMAAILKSIFKAIDKDGIGTSHDNDNHRMNEFTRRAKLDQIQGGLQRAIQDSTKGGCNNFFNFYALKLELFRVFALSD